MRTAQVLLRGSVLGVAEVGCGANDARWSAEETVTSFSVVLVRSGLFRRRVDGVESVAEPAPDRASAARPGTATRAGQLVDQIRQLLAESTDLRLNDLAEAAGVSAYHLRPTSPARCAPRQARHPLRCARCSPARRCAPRSALPTDSSPPRVFDGARGCRHACGVPGLLAFAVRGCFP